MIERVSQKSECCWGLMCRLRFSLSLQLPHPPPPAGPTALMPCHVRIVDPPQRWQAHPLHWPPLSHAKAPPSLVPRPPRCSEGYPFACQRVATPPGDLTLGKRPVPPLASASKLRYMTAVSSAPVSASMKARVLVTCGCVLTRRVHGHPIHACRGQVENHGNPQCVCMCGRGQTQRQQLQQVRYCWLLPTKTPPVCLWLGFCGSQTQTGHKP